MSDQTKNTSWDYYSRPDKSLKDISLEKVEKVIDLIKQRNADLHFDSPIEFLLRDKKFITYKTSYIDWRAFSPLVETQNFASLNF